jgi:hypothetical protein
VQWSRGFLRLTALVSGVVLVGGMTLAVIEGPTTEGMLLVLGLAAVPWLLFYALRWLAQGFRESPVSAASASAAPVAFSAPSTTGSPSIKQPGPKKRTNLFWPDVETIEGAKWATRQAFWAAIFCVGVTLFFVVLSLFGVEIIKGFGVSSLIDAALFAAIAFGLRRKSRFAAVAGLVLYLAERAYSWTETGSIGGNPALAIVLILGFVAGVRGAFAYQRLVRARRSPSDPLAAAGATGDGPTAGS